MLNKNFILKSFGIDLYKGRKAEPIGSISKNGLYKKIGEGKWIKISKLDNNNLSKENVEEKIKDVIKKSKEFAKKEGRVDNDIYIEPLGGKISLSKLKELRGNFLYTHLILNRDYTITSLPKEVKNVIVDRRTDKILGKKIEKPLKNQNININKIKVTQTFVFEKPLKNKTGNENITLYKYKENYYINDGNHSLIKKVLMGKKNIKADIILV